MGYIAHHTIVVTSSERVIGIAHDKAKEIFPRGVSELVGPLTNGYVSFFIAPDGSKEGWNESQDGDDRREKFMDWLDAHEDWYGDAIEVRFGGDDPQLSEIVRTAREAAE